jgi:hypothetical protein
MPANPKYLTKDPWQKFAKISAALLGGYLIAAGFFMALAFWLPNHRATLATFSYGVFILWVGLMFIPFLSENGWKCWAVFLVIILILSAAIYYGKQLNPIV